MIEHTMKWRHHIELGTTELGHKGSYKDQLAIQHATGLCLPLQHDPISTRAQDISCSKL